MGDCFHLLIEILSLVVIGRVSIQRLNTRIPLLHAGRKKQTRGSNVELGERL